MDFKNHFRRKARGMQAAAYIHVVFDEDPKCNITVLFGTPKYTIENAKGEEIRGLVRRLESAKTMAKDLGYGITFAYRGTSHKVHAWTDVNEYVISHVAGELQTKKDGGDHGTC